MDDVKEATKLLRQFADLYRSGAQGCEMDCDSAQAVAEAIDTALRPVRVTDEAVEDAARAMYLQFTGTDPDWKYRVDKNGYRQAPYVDEIPAWKWHWEAHARVALRAALSAVPGVVEGWQPIETAPKDKTPVIIAVPTKDRDDYHVGEAYFDPEHYEDGDWWWAGTDWSDYHAGPVSEVNFHGPTLRRPLPPAPSLTGGEQQ